MTFIGIDPGVSGGIAAIDARRNVELSIAMPDTEMDLVRTLELLSHPANRIGAVPVQAVLERVWSSPGWGHVGAFKFGMSYGGLCVGLTAARIPFDQIIPRKWQAALGVAYPPNATSTDKKNITKRRAQALFPKVSVTHAIADALLLAEYCRLLHAGSTIVRSAPQTKRGTHGKESR